MKKRILPLLLALVMVLALCPVPAFAADSGFTIENGVLTKYFGPGGDVVIPDGVTKIGDWAFSRCTGLTNVTIPNSVTSISDYAFSECTGLKSVTIPDSVGKISDGAFWGCTSLKSVTIPDSVTTIDNFAFSGCTGLKSVTIGSGVTAIGYFVFQNCTGLTSITVSGGNRRYSSIDGVLFSADKTLLIHFPAGSQGSYTIPDGVTSIGENAFLECTGLKIVTIPESVTEIGQSAFSGCTGLTNVCYDGSRERWKAISIGWGNDDLTSAPLNGIVPIAPIQIGDFTIEGGVLTGYSGSGGNITIPDGVTEIGDSAFKGCSVISVTIPEGVTTIGKQAFYNCQGLTTVTIPDSLTGIEEGAFYKCWKLENVTIPDGVTEIGDFAFGNCEALKSVTIPEGVTRIGNGAFYNCFLTSLTIPASVTSIGENAFHAIEIFPSYYWLINIYYGGSEAQWKAISIGENNIMVDPEYVTMHYNSAAPAEPEKPTSPIDAYKIDNWAKESVTAAFDAGLVPENVLNTDLTAGVTRAQFAAVAVKLYEAMSGEKAPSVTEDPFDDTDDPYVLQAYTLGLVSGNGAGGFDPDGILKREMAATLLSKVYIKLGGEIPKASATDFADDGKISSWARDSVSFMSQKGIVNGNGSGSFMPQDDMSGEGALMLAVQMLQDLEV